MSAQHKRPLLAFLVVVLLCVILLGHAVRSEALLGLLISADREPFGPEQARHSAAARDRVVADAPWVRSPRAPAGASATPAGRPAVVAPRPRSRPAHLGSVDGGGLLTRPQEQAAKPTPPGQFRAPREHARRTPFGHALGHAKRPAKSHGPGDGRLHVHGYAWGRAHSRGLAHRLGVAQQHAGSDRQRRDRP